MLFDTHCHIQFQGYNEDREEVLERCVEKNLILNAVGTQTDTSRAAVEMAENYENIYATIGTHPIHLFPTHVDEEESSFVSREEGFDEKVYEELAKSKKVIAVGETGLDFFHLPKDRPFEEIFEKQKQVFLAHAEFAHKHDLPLVIHCRSAHKELIEILQSLNREIKGTVHCFTGNWEQAKKYLDLGLHLGFTGVITFPPKKTDPKSQTDLLEVVKNTPIDKILTETDSPYLAPQAYRGKKCEPWMVEEVVKEIAVIRHKDYKEIEDIVLNNAKKLFKVA